MKTVIFLLIALNLLNYQASAEPNKTSPYLHEDSALAEALKTMLHGEASMEGTYQVKCLSQDRVLGLLPDQISLESSPLCQNGSHPVLFFFGVQKGLRAVTPLGTIKFSELYNESVMLIFSVRLKGSTERFSYVPQIKVDSLPAYIFALPYGGLNKHMSYIQHSGTDFEIFKKQNGEKLATAGWSLESGSSSSKDENFGLLQPYFQDRVVAKNKFFYNCFTFDWNFQVGKVVPALLSFELMDGYVGGAFTGMYNDKLTLNDSPMGAFHASNDWKMGLPGNCR